MHRQVAGPTAAAVAAAVRGDHCAPAAAPIDAGSLFYGVAQVLGMDGFRALWSAFQQSPRRGNPLEFADFIATRPQGQAVPALADLARFDLAYGLAAQPGPMPSVAACCLPELLLRSHPQMLLRFQPGWRYLALNWPVHRLLAQVPTTALLEQLVPEVVRLRIAPTGMGVALEELDAAAYALQTALRGGQRLGEAAHAAAAIDPAFDPFSVVAGLVEAGAIMDVVLHPAAAPSLEQPNP